MQKELLVVNELTVSLSGRKILDGVSFAVSEGECLAVLGRSGSGKTVLLKALMGQLFSRGLISFVELAEGPAHISLISRQHRFTNLSNLSSFYYQQRFNSFDAEDSSTVEDDMKATGARESSIISTLDKLRIRHLLHSKLIQLSNGEHKRFQIAKALLQNTDWLLLDSPYIGLDVQARQMLNGVLQELVTQGMHILLVSSPGEIPEVVTHVAVLEEGRLGPRMTRREVTQKPRPGNMWPIDVDAIKVLPAAYPYEDFDTAVRMVNTCIKYNDKLILDNVNWEIKKGDRWHLAGPNGSGKSTLLSLINGDNPQAFANQIWLFDKKKGTGESIWDIKQKIGYVSPELHHYFDAGSNCFDLVASGLFDTIGLFRKLNREQEWITEEWMKALHLNRFKDRMFYSLSDGEQRLMLLARALVKNPPMLILDEPCQGLDEETSRTFISLVDQICISLGKTLIYVSHYASELPSCVDKKLTLNEGRQFI